MEKLSERRWVRLNPALQLETGLSFFRDAEAYRKAADAISEPSSELMDFGLELDEWVKLYRPAANLFCHAIELYLKSFLRAHGSSELILRRTYGHDLLRIAGACKAAGLILSEETTDLIDSVAPDFAAFRFRYPDTKSMTIIAAQSFKDACSEIRKAIYPAINRRMQKDGAELSGPFREKSGR